MKGLNALALILVIVGGINWGLVGLFDLDLVAAIFGADTLLTNIVYIVVGAAAVYCLMLLKKVTTDDVRHVDHDVHRTTTTRV